MTDVDMAALEAIARAGPYLVTDDPGPDPGPASPPAHAAATQRVVVTLEGGETWAVTLDARDRRAYALMADRYKLPAFTLGPDGDPDVLKLELLTVFSAWHATRHRLRLHALDWPAFNAALIDLEVIRDAPEVTPHPPAPGVG